MKKPASKTRAEQRDEDFKPSDEDLPSDSARAVTVGDMFTLARRLRSKAKWEISDGYYTTEAESAKNDAMREVYNGVAGEIDEFFGFDSSPYSNKPSW